MTFSNLTGIGPGIVRLELAVGIVDNAFGIARIVRVSDIEVPLVDTVDYHGMAVTPQVKDTYKLRLLCRQYGVSK